MLAQIFKVHSESRIQKLIKLYTTSQKFRTTEHLKLYRNFDRLIALSWKLKFTISLFNINFESKYRPKLLAGSVRMYIHKWQTNYLCNSVVPRQTEDTNMDAWFVYFRPWIFQDQTLQDLDSNPDHDEAHK